MGWENPECDTPEKMVILGTTSRGTPVWINKTVAESDLVISIGCIEPHIIASFGGGYKNIVPGVAGRQTIAHNHALNCAPDTFNNVGRPIDGNPMRLDLEEAARMLKPPVFIINAILNYRQGVVKIVAGDPIEAHRAGVQDQRRTVRSAKSNSRWISSSPPPIRWISTFARESKRWRTPFGR